MSMIPIICVGHIPLIGTYITSMCIAVVLDGNHEPLLLAFALGTINYDDHIFDSIDFAVQRVYPDSYHGYCCKNIAKKIRASTGNNTVVEQLFWKTCKTYNVSDFYASLNSLQNEVNENDLHWLDNIAVAKW
ncbi:hypothetical protein Lser_V15G41996 [Lactuca serriola]